MKNKKLIILIAAISITLIGILAIVLNKNFDLLSKLKSSVIDPETGETCIEETNSSNILHENGETVKKILDDLYAEKDSTCSTGYRCDKPTIPTQVEPESCFTLNTTNIMYNNGTDNITVEDALKELYRIYNSASFCPQKYCNPVTYTVTLNKNGGTSQGTTAIYQKYDTAVYLDQAETQEMTDSANPITKPQKVYTITYDANGQGASYTPSPTSSTTTFKGYFTESSGGTKMIDQNGYIVPANFPNNKYSADATLYAQYDNTAITLPAITKANHTCKWAEGSSSGTQYTGGTSRTITGNTTYYAKCVTNPIITVINKTCNENGTGCTQQSSTTYQKAPGTTETINPGSYSGYSAPSGKSVTYDSNHTLTFYHTKNQSYSNFGQGSNISGYTVSANSNNTNMTLRSSASGAQCMIIWPVGQNASGENNQIIINNGAAIEWSRFNNSMSGYDATYRQQYGMYFASDLSDCNNSYSGVTSASMVIRPYIEVKYKVDGNEVGSTQVKTLNNAITLAGAPTKSGWTFKTWQAYAQTSNSTGIANSNYAACSQNGNVYYPANYTINASSWNISNGSWPCPNLYGYMNNIETVYMQAIFQKNPWVEYN